MHITLHDTCTPGYLFYQTKRHFLFQTQQKAIPYQSILSVDRFTGKCDEITQKEFFDLLRTQEPMGQASVWAIYGIIVVEEVPYLAVVKNARLVTAPKQTPVYEVKELQFVRFDPDKGKTQGDQERRVLDFINEELVAEKFYFSYTEDLTQSFRKKMKNPFNELSSSKFFWNEKNVEFLQVNGLNKPWIVPMIQGYVASITSNHLEYRIIARRSKHMSGTRYNNRGVNPDGFASNFVEIEERIEHGGLIFSFVTLRGSVPLFWQEQGGFYTIEFPNTEDKCLKGLKRHYDDLATDYQCTINTINLLSDLKQRQKPLIDRFYKLLTTYGCKTYYAFDFNKDAQTLHQNIATFITTYQQKQSANNFQCFDIKNDKQLHKQDFIPRVNCLDCIDRTNVICCRIGECFVRKVCGIVGVEQTQEFHEKYLERWRDVGNQISLIYCGTASVAEHLTMKQEHTYWSSFTSSWRSVNRYFNASQSDVWKEQCNRYLLRENEKSITTYFGDNIARFSLRPSDYCTFSEVDIAIMTWNVAATTPTSLTQPNKLSISRQIFGPSHQKSPPMILITLQQIVQLTSYNVLSNDNTQAKKQWQHAFTRILNDYNPNNAGFTYVLYFSHALVGVMSLVFVKSSLDHRVDWMWRVKKVFGFEVKRGYGGNLGNKGAIVSGFWVNDSKVMWVGCHLAAGDDKKKERVEDIEAILEAVKGDSVASKWGWECDFVFFTGDLNFRLMASDEEVKATLQLAKSLSPSLSPPSLLPTTLKHLNQLLRQQQLLTLLPTIPSLAPFQQHPITFYPTYRYLKDSPLHDQKRKPGWCDRIIFSSLQSHSIKCQNYTSVDEVMMSDHRAVVAAFVIMVRQENREKKQLLVEECLRKRGEGKKGEEKSVIQEPKYGFPKTRYNY